MQRGLRLRRALGGANVAVFENFRADPKTGASVERLLIGDLVLRQVVAVDLRNAQRKIPT